MKHIFFQTILILMLSCKKNDNIEPNDTQSFAKFKILTNGSKIVNNGKPELTIKIFDSFLNWRDQKNEIMKIITESNEIEIDSLEEKEYYISVFDQRDFNNYSNNNAIDSKTEKLEKGVTKYFVATLRDDLFFYLVGGTQYKWKLKKITFSSELVRNDSVLTNCDKNRLLIFSYNQTFRLFSYDYPQQDTTCSWIEGEWATYQRRHTDYNKQIILSVRGFNIPRSSFFYTLNDFRRIIFYNDNKWLQLINYQGYVEHYERENY